MKRTIVLLLAVITAFSCLFAQASKNPFTKLGYKKQVVYSSSKGEFDEFHDQEYVVEIGSVYFNTKTNKVVGLVSEEGNNKKLNPATTAMSVDPLCEKYYWISPYAYCLNNPVKYTDPTGKWIAGTDGNPVSFTKGQWSSNASPDVQRMGNAMFKSGTASRQLFGMMDNTAKISIKISDETVKGADGGYVLGKTDPGKVFVDNDNNNNITKVDEYNVVIYEGSIKEALGILNGNSGDDKYKGLTVDQGIAVNASHESVHTEVENTQQAVDNMTKNSKNDLEAQPNKTAEKAAEELKINKKIGQ